MIKGSMTSKSEKVALSSHFIRFIKESVKHDGDFLR